MKYLAIIVLMYGAMCQGTYASQPTILYVPSVTVHRTMSRPYFRSQPYRGGSANQPMPSVTRGRGGGWMPGAFDNPKLIINPFVDQTPYKGLGEQFIR